MPKEVTTRRTTVRKVLGSAGVISKVQKKENVNKPRQRTPENDVRNRGKHIDGWAFDPNWVKEGLQMASLVEIKRNIFE